MKSFIEEYGITIVVATVIMGLIGTATFFKTTGGNSLKGMTNNFLQEAQLADSEEETAGYTVTINLTNPVNGDRFGSATVYDDYTTHPGHQSQLTIGGNVIGTFSSATDSITVTTTTGKLVMHFYAPADMYFRYPSITGAITKENEFSETTIDENIYYPCVVNSDGTITFDRLDWND